MPKIPAHRARRKPPFFRPAPVRHKTNAWGDVQQCVFLGELYLSGSVSFAAGRVGLSRASAYRARNREGAEGFAWAWDYVLTPPGRGHVAKPRIEWRGETIGTLSRWTENGFVKPVLYQGTVKAIARKPDNSALLKLLSRMDTAQRWVDVQHEKRSGKSFEKGGVRVPPSTLNQRTA